MVLEVVLENVAEALTAQKYGAKRVEICGALDLGGITPSAGIIKECLRLCTMEVHVMIRPRSGGFCYSDVEKQVMYKDIEECASLGCVGVVFGLLDEKGNIDTENTSFLSRHAKTLGLEVTFHRAIDFSNDIFIALEEVISTGADRILVAGHPEGVSKGHEVLKKLKQAAAGRIQIMAGGAVSPDDMQELIEADLDAVHINIRKSNHDRYNAHLGNEYDIDENKIASISGMLL